MNIIVTGASKGIGNAIATGLAREGHKVYGFSRSVLENSLFHGVSVDVTNSSQIENAVQEIIHKEGRIDVLINNAGVGMVGPVEDTTKSDVHRLFDVNLIGSVQMIAAVLPVMRRQRSGKILNISSIGSVMGLPFRGFYSASKAALDKVTEALRYEVRPWNIQAASLHLGDIKTDIAEGRIKTTISTDYEKVFNTVYTSMDSEVEKGFEPDRVAVYILKLLKKKTWKAHYYFGKFGQKIAVPLKWILPQLFFEKLMRKYSKIR